MALLMGPIGMGVDAHVRGQSWSRQKNVLQKGIRWRVNDLRAAGLNPVLAASGGFGGAGSAPSMASSSSAGFASAAAAGTAAGTGRKRVNSELVRNTALAGAADAMSYKTRQEGINAEAMEPYFRSQAEKMSVDAQTAKIQQDTMAAQLIPLQALADMLKDNVTKEQWQNFQLYQPKGLIEKALAIGKSQQVESFWDRQEEKGWKTDQSYKRSPLRPTPPKPRRTKHRR